MDKIIARIQKLLALAKDAGATEAEAQMAMEKASALLAEHNLSMEQVEKTSSMKTKMGHGMARSNKNNWLWHSDLWEGAAKLNFCHYMFARAEDGNLSDYVHIVTGRDVNLLATRIMAEYLVETVNRITKDVPDSLEHQAMQLISGVGMPMYCHRFKQGMARRLLVRMEELKELRSKKPTVSGGINLPALADAYEQANNQALALLEKEGVSISQQETKVRGGLGYDAGKKAADQVNLEQQLSHQSQAAGLSLTHQG